MSIYVYVTRKLGPLLDQDGPAISPEEWIRVVAGDSDLSIAEPSSFKTKGAIYAVWTSYPGGHPAWFAWINGSIEVKGLDEAVITKLRYFAKSLDARIVSETGEEFS